MGAPGDQEISENLEDTESHLHRTRWPQASPSLSEPQFSHLSYRDGTSGLNTVDHCGSQQDRTLTEGLGMLPTAPGQSLSESLPAHNQAAPTA